MVSIFSDHGCKARKGIIVRGIEDDACMGQVRLGVIVGH